MTRESIRTNFKGKTALHPIALCCYTSATPNSDSYAGMIRQGLRLTLCKHLAQHRDWESRIKDGSPIKLPCRHKVPFLIKVPLGALVTRKVWKLILPPRNNLQKVRPSYSPNSKFLFLKESHRTGVKNAGSQLKCLMAAVEAIVISSKSEIFERSKESQHSDSLFESLKSLWRNGLPALGVSLTQAKLLIEYRRSHELFGPLRVNIS